MIESICFALAAIVAPTPAPLPTYQFTTQDVICADGVCRVVTRPVLRPVARIVTSPRSLPFFSFRAAAVHRSVGGTDAFTGSFSGGSVGSYAGGSVGQTFGSYGSAGSSQVVTSQSGAFSSVGQKVVVFPTRNGTVYARAQNGQDRLLWRATRRQSWAQRPGVFNWRWRVANRANR